MRSPHGQKDSLRRTKHFVEMCILYPREKIIEWKYNVDDSGQMKIFEERSFYRKKLTLSILDLQWWEGGPDQYS